LPLLPEVTLLLMELIVKMKQDIQELGVCAYLMNPPFSLSTNIANNQTMEALSLDARRIDAVKRSNSGMLFIDF